MTCSLASAIALLTTRSGLPSGKPAVGAVDINGFRSIDISNPLPGNVRYLVDRGYSGADTVVRVRMIDAVTGKRVSPPVTIATSSYTFVQNVAVDPDGHFVIYSEVGESSCPPGHFSTGTLASSNLWFQKLGSGGVPVGNRIKIVGCGDIPGGPGAIDIMKVQ